MTTEIYKFKSFNIEIRIISIKYVKFLRKSTNLFEIYI